ncbi:MAG TPA: toll/interleukin-1 receptor domain-containing protein [Mycobacteriales bacterium]|nr:toll/interleukin-1 receptor domain-containing protein [Mycobacteriales bacterium]
MDTVFINYRSEDEPFGAALIDHELSTSFGPDRVFLDSRSIRPGEDFAKVILPTLRQSSALLVVIGPRWLDAADETGRRRLDDPGDWVRLEIAEALRHGVRVIPLLVNADLPRANELPTDIAALVRCQYLRLHHRNSRHDIARLVNELAEILPHLVPLSRRRVRRRRLVVGIAVLATVTSVVGLTTLALRNGGNQPAASSTTPHTSSPVAGTVGPQSPTSPAGSPPVQQERTVILDTTQPKDSVAIDYWRQLSNTGDVHVDATGLYTTAGAKVAIIETAPPADYARCAHVTGWQTRVPFTALSVGSQMCAYSTQDRYALLRVKSVPSGDDPRFIFYGRTWEHAG